MHANARSLLVAAALTAAAPPAFANVITDWDEKAVATVAPMSSLDGTSPYTAVRMMGMVHAAMFDAVNSIEPLYRPYLVQLPASPTTSKEAAAAAAAASILATIDAKTAGEMKVTLATYLASIPDGVPKSEGVKLGEAVAAKILEARANDGSDAPDAYRPRTTPGVYVPTAITLSSMWPTLKPFALTNPAQFRPKPPISLESEAWATDYNELKDHGGKKSAKRTAQQTETALFWTSPLLAYQPLRTAAGDRNEDECCRQRSVHGARGGCAQRRDHRCAGRQVPLQLLATDHGNSQRRYRWQPGYGS